MNGLLLLLGLHNCCYLLVREWSALETIIKPPPPIGAGGGYMFSGRPSVRASVRASVIHVVVLCFRDISSICWWIFAKLLSLVHLGTARWPDYVFGSKGQSSRSRHPGGGAQHSTLPSCATFSSFYFCVCLSVRMSGCLSKFSKCFFSGSSCPNELIF